MMQINRKIIFPIEPGRPLAAQIEQGLLRLIETGAIGPDTPLPTVRALAAQLGVNFNTVARAYRSLDDRGVIVTRQGRGTYIRAKDTGISVQQADAEQLGEILLQFRRRLENAGFSSQQIQDAFSHAAQAQLAAMPALPDATAPAGQTLFISRRMKRSKRNQNL